MSSGPRNKAARALDGRRAAVSIVYRKTTSSPTLPCIVQPPACGAAADCTHMLQACTGHARGAVHDLAEEPNQACSPHSALRAWCYFACVAAAADLACAPALQQDDSATLIPLSLLSCVARQPCRHAALCKHSSWACGLVMHAMWACQRTEPSLLITMRCIPSGLRSRSLIERPSQQCRACALDGRRGPLCIGFAAE